MEWNYSEIVDRFFFIRDEIGNTRKNDAKQIPRLIMESALSVREKLFSIRIYELRPRCYVLLFAKREM